MTEVMSTSEPGGTPPNAVVLVGPGELVTAHVPLPAADVRESLRFGELPRETRVADRLRRSGDRHLLPQLTAPGAPSPERRLRGR